MLAVFAYHMRPGYVSGGFIGVDVFFVLSGFLISTHLLEELQRTGRIQFGKFWARRAKRLLPASFAVLAATGIAVWFFAPMALQERFYRDISAATLYVANWVFAFDSVDYLAADNSPSVVQHFWSLGVEEQLYIAWPLLLAAAWVFGLKLQRGALAAAVLLSLITLSSFTYSALMVFDGNPIAYFSTLSRAWEFGAGALLALWMLRSKALEPTAFGLRHVAAWTGWLALVAYILLFEASAGFPGVNALIPVIATLLIIWANDPGGRFGPAAILRLRPIQFVGDASYSIYLWHWPLLVFAGFYFANIPSWMLAIIFATTLGLSAISMRFIENPFRYGRLKTSLRPRQVFVGVATGMLVLVGTTQAAGLQIANQVAIQEQETLALEEELNKALEERQESVAEGVAKAPIWDELSCMGPAFLVEEECGEFRWETYVPGIKVGEETAHDVVPLERIGSDKGCLSWGDNYSLIECVYGVRGGERVLLIGDSHAYHWLPAFARVATNNNLELHMTARAGCPGNTVPKIGSGEQVRGCFQWMDEFKAWFSQQQKFEKVVIANYVGTKFEGSGVKGQAQPEAVQGFKEFWGALIDSGAEVIVLKDTPYIGADAWNCMVNNPENPDGCDVSRKFIDGQFDNSAAAAQELGLRVIDMTDYFCTEDTCQMVVGGVRVYRDSNHMSGTYNLLLTPYLAQKLIG